MYTSYIQYHDTSKITGIGKETAEILSLTGATVIIGSRSIKRGNIAKSEIIEINKNRTNKELNIDVMKLNLSSISSVDSFLTQFKSKYNSLDILICNAAVNPLEDGLKNADGLELAFGVNHIAHFYLVNQLKPLLTKNKDSRIVMVSAIPYEDPRAKEIFDITDLNQYNQWDAYFMSKVENIMMTREFAKRYPSQSNNGLKIVSLHPGVGPTDLFNNRDEIREVIVPNNRILVSIFNVLFAYLSDSIEQLSYTQLYLSLTDIKNIVSGGHYRNEEQQKLFGGIVDNDDLCKKLWEKSDEIINDIKQK